MLKNILILIILFFLVLINFVVDILDVLERLLETAIPGILFFIFQGFNTAVDFVVSFFTTIILTAIGGLHFRRLASYIVTSLLEFIPVVDFLPLRTIGLILTIILMEKAKRKEKSELKEIQEQKEEEQLED